MRISALLLVLLTALPQLLVSQTLDNDAARNRWNEGYKLMEAAQRAEEQRSHSQALDGFRAALAEFTVVQRQNPQWNPSLIAFRIDHCKRRIDALEDNLAPSVAAANDDDRDYKRLYGILLSKAKPLNDAYLRQKVEIEQLKKALADAQAEAARLSERESRAEALAKENHRLVGQLAAKERELRQATADLLELRKSAGLADELAKLQQEQRLATLREAELEAERRRLAGEAAALREEAKDLSIARSEALHLLNTAKERETRLQNRIAAQDQALQQAAEERNAARAQTPALQNQIAALNAELTDMRKLLSEQAKKLNQTANTPQTKPDHEAKFAAQIANLRSALAQARADANLAREKSAAGETEARSLRHELDKLQLANRLLREQEAAKTTPVDTRNFTEMQREMVDLRAAKAALEAENKTLNDRDAAQMTFVRTLREKIELQNQELEAAKKKAANLEGRLASANAATESELAIRLEGHRLAVARLQKDLADRDATIRSLQTRMLAQRSDKPVADDEGRALKARLAELVTELAALRTGGSSPTPSPVAPLTPAPQPQPVASGPAAPAAPTLADRQAADDEAAVELLLTRADEAEQRGNLEAATWNYRQALEKDPQRQHALVRLGNLLADAGDFDAAERYLMRAFYNNPDDMELLMPLGFLLAHQGKADMAVSMLSRATALYPDNPEFHRYLGVACRSLGWADAAEKQFLRSWKLDEKSADTAFNLAVLIIAADPARAAEAKTWYDRARALGSAPDPQLEQILAQ